MLRAPDYAIVSVLTLTPRDRACALVCVQRIQQRLFISLATCLCLAGFLCSKRLAARQAFFK